MDTEVQKVQEARHEDPTDAGVTHRERVRPEQEGGPHLILTERRAPTHPRAPPPGGVQPPGPPRGGGGGPRPPPAPPRPLTGGGPSPPPSRGRSPSGPPA